jgi:prepilin-type N-terminal cleavage/methylation domain-containing protein/prepilin-type processing-associated H-X9-DG protein
MICGQPASRSRSGTSRFRRGFTLVELLLVIVILVFLAALLSPALSMGWRAARQTKCKANLWYIGQAYGMRAADELEERVGPLDVGGWPSMLGPYFENSPDILKCPEGAFKVASLTSLIRIDFPELGGHSVTLDDSKNVAKMSEEQYQYFWDKGQFKGSRQPHIYNEYQGYVEGANPNVIWYCIEDEVVPRLPTGDWYMDKDFEDIRLRVENLGGNLLRLSMDMGSGIGGIIVRQDTGEVLYRLPLYWNRYTRGNLIELGTFWAGECECSYGMNVHVRDLKGEGGKVLALDYCKVVAKTTDDWTDEFFDPDADEAPDFARHFGRANVLLLDGSVRTFAPYEIDPISPSTARTWWEP